MSGSYPKSQAGLTDRLRGPDATGGTRVLREAERGAEWREVTYVRTRRSREDEPLLTRREMEVFSMVSRGHSVEEIARQMFISPSEVRTIVANIRRKGWFRGR